jgi:hypothetical protein
MKSAFLLLAAVQATLTAPPPRAVPFDCSWIYHPPTGSPERFEGVYTSFIDDGGFYACPSDEACRNWIGKEKVEIAFSERASAELHRRRVDNYGVFRIVFEGRRGKFGDRPGCEANEWSLEARGDDYVRVERVLAIKPQSHTRR